MEERIQMVYCVLCGHRNEGDARFCVNCGAELMLPDPESMESSEVIAPENAKEEPKQSEAATPEKRRRRKNSPEREAIELVPDTSEPPADPGEAELLSSPDAAPVDDLADMADSNSIPEAEAEVQEQPEADVDAPEDALPAEQGETKENAALPEKEWMEPERIDSYIPPAMPPVYSAAPEYYRSQTEDSRYLESARPSGYAEPSPAFSMPVGTVQPKPVKPLSTAAFFWLKVLFMIPGLGFIMAIVFSATPVNTNLQRYSRATLIFQILACIVILFVLLSLVIISQRFGPGWWDVLGRPFNFIFYPFAY